MTPVSFSMTTRSLILQELVDTKRRQSILLVFWYFLSLKKFKNVFRFFRLLNLLGLYSNRWLLKRDCSGRKICVLCLSIGLQGQAIPPGPLPLQPREFMG